MPIDTTALFVFTNFGIWHNRINTNIEMLHVEQAIAHSITLPAISFTSMLDEISLHHVTPLNEQNISLPAISQEFTHILV